MELRQPLVANQVVCYEDGLVEVNFTEGSSLQLSPCGAVFRHVERASGHPLQGCAEVQQMSRFVTSAFREKLLAAVDFRNRFSPRPYLCPALIDSTSIVLVKIFQKLHADMFEVAWPRQLSSDTGPAERLQDGTLRVTSVDECASVLLAPNKQHFTTRYLAKVSQAVARKIGVQTDKPSTESTQAQSVDSEKLSETSNANKSETNRSAAQTIDRHNRWDYVWVVQHHSMAMTPDCWQHPVNLLLNDGDDSDTPIQCDGSKLRNVTCRQHGHTTKTLCVVSAVPRALPVTCPAAHCHRWAGKQSGRAGAVYDGGRPNVICLRGIIYRVVKNKSGAVVGMEIYTGDGSIMRSHGLVAHYYKHYSVNDGTVEDRMYAVEHPPPDVPGFTYSISKIMERATKLFHQAQDASVSLQEEHVSCLKFCSSGHNMAALQTELLEQCEAAEIGRFTAFSNGRVRIVFTDRTCLDMQADFSRRLASTRSAALASSLIEKNRSDGSLRSGIDVPEGMCRLFLPSGHYHMVKITQPEQYTRYVQAALEWANWVNSTPSERCLHYKDTIYDDTKHGRVEAELAKINCFNYIVENKLKPSIQTTAPHRADSTTPVHACPPDSHVSKGLIDMSAVQQALERTSSAVRELEVFLASS